MSTAAHIIAMARIPTAKLDPDRPYTVSPFAQKAVLLALLVLENRETNTGEVAELAGMSLRGTLMVIRALCQASLIIDRTPRTQGRRFTVYSVDWEKLMDLVPADKVLELAQRQPGWVDKRRPA